MGRKRDPIEEAVLAERLRCARIAESWPLSPQNMIDADRWEKAGGCGNAVAATCYKLAAIIRQCKAALEDTER